MIVRFEDSLELHVQPDDGHEWLLSTEQVAEGYGVNVATIRGHKLSHADELCEGRHFISVRNSNANPRAGIPHEFTLWTKRGVVRLGFFIRSERAKKFRDFCEDLVIDTLEPTAAPAPTQTSIQLPTHPALNALDDPNLALTVLAALPVSCWLELFKFLAKTVRAHAHQKGMTEANATKLLRGRFDLSSYHDLPLRDLASAIEWLDSR
jgi:hypothetical protein